MPLSDVVYFHNSSISYATLSAPEESLPSFLSPFRWTRTTTPVGILSLGRALQLEDHSRDGGFGTINHTHLYCHEMHFILASDLTATVWALILSTVWLLEISSILPLRLKGWLCVLCSSIT